MSLTTALTLNCFAKTIQGDLANCFLRCNSFRPKTPSSGLKKQGVHLVAEADGRMFPDTNSSATIVDCYLAIGKRISDSTDVRTALSPLSNLLATRQLKLHIRGKESLTADAVLDSDGKLSLRLSSCRSLWDIRSQSLAPSLFSFKIKDPLITGLQGLSFLDASTQAYPSRKESIQGKRSLCSSRIGV